MVLCNVYIPGKEGLHHIRFSGQKIISVYRKESKTDVNETIIDCEGAWALPGLINSHDHLDFNLFPQLGNKVYNNYTEWGLDIHAHNKEEIAAVEKIPHYLRVKWGMYKNLLCGVTTVVNHGKRLAIDNELITVFQDCYCLHSPAFEKNWKWKLNGLKGMGKTVVMHMGEGMDQKANAEIDEVIRWNFFKRKIVAVHGVAMNAKQARNFKALVWCPASNEFLLKQTAKLDQLKGSTEILFGTDSTLTASWNIWEHLRMAAEMKLMSDEELFAAVTTNAARVWGLNAGELIEGKDADIVITRKTEGKSFISTNPEDIRFIIRKGQLRSREEIVQGELNKLITEIKKYYTPLYYL